MKVETNMKMFELFPIPNLKWKKSPLLELVGFKCLNIL